MAMQTAAGSCSAAFFVKVEAAAVDGRCGTEGGSPVLLPSEPPHPNGSLLQQAYEAFGGQPSHQAAAMEASAASGQHKAADAASQLPEFGPGTQQAAALDPVAQRAACRHVAAMALDAQGVAGIPQLGFAPLPHGGGDQEGEEQAGEAGEPAMSRSDSGGGDSLGAAGQSAARAQQALSGGVRQPAKGRRKPHLQGRFSGRLATKEDEKRLVEECRLLGPLLGGVGKRGDGSRLTLAKIVRGIAAGEVRKYCEEREHCLQALKQRASMLDEAYRELEQLKREREQLDETLRRQLEERERAGGAMLLAYGVRRASQTGSGVLEAPPLPGMVPVSDTGQPLDGGMVRRQTSITSVTDTTDLQQQQQQQGIDAAFAATGVVVTTAISAGAVSEGVHAMEGVTGAGSLAPADAGTLGVTRPVALQQQLQQQQQQQPSALMHARAAVPDPTDALQVHPTAAAALPVPGAAAAVVHQVAALSNGTQLPVGLPTSIPLGSMAQPPMVALSLASQPTAVPHAAAAPAAAAPLLPVQVVAQAQAVQQAAQAAQQQAQSLQAAAHVHAQRAQEASHQVQSLQATAQAIAQTHTEIVHKIESVRSAAVAHIQNPQQPIPAAEVVKVAEEAVQKLQAQAQAQAVAAMEVSAAAQRAEAEAHKHAVAHAQAAVKAQQLQAQAQSLQLQAVMTGVAAAAPAPAPAVDAAGVLSAGSMVVAAHQGLPVPATAAAAASGAAAAGALPSRGSFTAAPAPLGALAAPQAQSAAMHAVISGVQLAVEAAVAPAQAAAGVPVAVGLPGAASVGVVQANPSPTLAPLHGPPVVTTQLPVAAATSISLLAMPSASMPLGASAAAPSQQAASSVHPIGNASQAQALPVLLAVSQPMASGLPHMPAAAGAAAPAASTHSGSLVGQAPSDGGGGTPQTHPVEMVGQQQQHVAVQQGASAAAAHQAALQQAALQQQQQLQHQHMQQQQQQLLQQQQQQMQQQQAVDAAAAVAQVAHVVSLQAQQQAQQAAHAHAQQAAQLHQAHAAAAAAQAASIQAQQQAQMHAEHAAAVAAAQTSLQQQVPMAQQPARQPSASSSTGIIAALPPLPSSAASISGSTSGLPPLPPNQLRDASVSGPIQGGVQPPMALPTSTAALNGGAAGVAPSEGSAVFHALMQQQQQQVAAAVAAQQQQQVAAAIAAQQQQQATAVAAAAQQQQQVLMAAQQQQLLQQHQLLPGREGAAADVTPRPSLHGTPPIPSPAEATAAAQNLEALKAPNIAYKVMPDAGFAVRVEAASAAPAAGQVAAASEAAQAASAMQAAHQLRAAAQQQQQQLLMQASLPQQQQQAMAVPAVAAATLPLVNGQAGQQPVSGAALASLVDQALSGGNRSMQEPVFETAAAAPLTPLDPHVFLGDLASPMAPGLKDAPQVAAQQQQQAPQQRSHSMQLPPLPPSAQQHVQQQHEAAKAAAAAAGALRAMDAIEAQLNARGGVHASALDAVALSSIPADLDPETVDRLMQAPTPGSMAATPLTGGPASPGVTGVTVSTGGLLVPEGLGCAPPPHAAM